MSAPSKQILATASLRPREGDSTDHIRVQVLGEATANPDLIIAPCVDQDGALRGQFMILHMPTGYAVVMGDAPWKLRPIADAIADLDWGSVTTVDGFGGTDLARSAAAAIKTAQLTEPTVAELPAHDAWGKDGKGKGLQRAAIPQVIDTLADLQLASNKIHGDEAIPLDVPDPSRESGTRPNPEWTSWIVRQVHDFGLAYLLLALHRIDPTVADSAAAWLADQWESGDSLGEWAWDWAQALAKGETPKIPGVPERQELLTAI